MLDVGPDLDVQLERVASAPHDARRAMAKMLDDATHDEFWGNAILATSEIVTHSLTHSSGQCRLTAWHSPAAGWLRVEVTDAGGELPSLGAETGHPEMGGLRLAVLLEVPAAWGVDTTPFGRVVWFEIQRSVAAPARA